MYVCVCEGGEGRLGCRFIQGGAAASVVGLRAAYDRRGLQEVEPSVRRGRGELRARTPPHFRVATTKITSATYPSLLYLSSIQFNSHLFLSPIGGPVRCPSLTRLPVWESIPGPLLNNHSCSAVGAEIISLRSDDLVVPKLPEGGRE